MKGLNNQFLNPEILDCLFKPNDWVNYLRYIEESHIYSYQKIYLYKRIWHINLLKTYRVAYYAWMIKLYIRQHWIESHPLYIAVETYDFRRRETTTSNHLFSLKSIYQKSYHWTQYLSYTKMHITKVIFFSKVYKYQNSHH